MVELAYHEGVIAFVRVLAKQIRGDLVELDRQTWTVLAEAVQVHLPRFNEAVSATALEIYPYAYQKPPGAPRKAIPQPLMRIVVAVNGSILITRPGQRAWEYDLEADPALAVPIQKFIGEQLKDVSAQHNR